MPWHLVQIVEVAGHDLPALADPPPGVALDILSRRGSNPLGSLVLNPAYILRGSLEIGRDRLLGLLHFLRLVEVRLLCRLRVLVL